MASIAIDKSGNSKSILASVIFVLAGLVSINVLAHLTSLSAMAATVPVGVLVLIIAAKINGVTWKELGLGRETLLKGTTYAAASLAVISLVVGIALAIPFTRDFFLNESYRNVHIALISALVFIPLQTVIPEEMAFRGLLHGRLMKLGGTKTAFIVGSLAFGLWHVLSSLSLTATNVKLVEILGSGTLAQWIGVAGAVIATATAGAGLTWLRYKTNSVIAPVGLHWALNSSGALAAAAAWTLL